MKKGLFAVIAINLAVAVSILTYTIVASVTGGSKKAGEAEQPYQPVSYTLDVALRVNDTYALEAGEVSFEGLKDGQDAQIIHTENTTYTAKNEGTVKAVVVKENADKYIYNISIYAFGEGTDANPYNICKASHLLEFFGEDVTVEDMTENLSKSYSIRANIDLAGVAWKPIGRLDGSYSAQNSGNYSYGDYTFYGKINGNGYAIENMKVAVNENNFTDYVACANGQWSFVLGFIGSATNAKIENLTFNNAQVSIDKAVMTKEFKPSDFDLGDSDAITTLAAEEAKVDVCVTISAAVVVGNVICSTVDSVSVNNSYVSGYNVYFNEDSGNRMVYDAIAGVAATVKYTTINNCKLVNTKVEAIDKTTTVAGIVGVVRIEIEGNYVVSPADYAGRIGLNTSIGVDTSITNCTLNSVNVIGYRDGESITAGIVACVQNTIVDNIKGSIKISLNGTSTSVAQVAGGVYEQREIKGRNYTGVEVEGVIADNYVSTIKNCELTLNMDTYKSNVSNAQVAGFVFANQSGTIMDNKVNGTITGLYVAGQVYFNFGSVVFSSTFTGNAVNLAIGTRVAAAGLVFENHGIVDGGENKAQVVANIAWIYPKGIFDLDVFKILAGCDAAVAVDVAAEKYVSAGLVAYTSGVASKVVNFNVVSNIQDSVVSAGIIGVVGETISRSKLITTTNAGEEANKKTSFEYVETAFTGSGEVANIVSSATIQTLYVEKDVSPLQIMKGSKRASAGFGRIVSGTTISNIAVSGSINANKTGSCAYAAGLVSEISAPNAFTFEACKVENMIIAVSQTYYDVANVAGFIALANCGANTITLTDCVNKMEAVAGEGIVVTLFTVEGKVINKVAIVEGETTIV